MRIMPRPLIRRIAVLTCSIALTVLTGSPAIAAPPPGIDPVPADRETTPVEHSGDAADDPAIWVHPTKPAESLVFGNDKQGALEVYNLSGERVQRITEGNERWGNVDVRQQVTLGGRTLDVVGAVQGGMRFYVVDRSSGRLSPITDGPLPTGGGEGFCLYHSPFSGTLYAFVVKRDGLVRQFAITDSDQDGSLERIEFREFEVGSEAEGCVADDETGAFYVSEEDVGVWRYDAEPDGGRSRTLVDSVGSQGNLVPDSEGLTLVHLPGRGGYLLASAQHVNDPRNSYFTVYERTGDNGFVKAFRVVEGDTADGCQRTDGIATYAGDLGPSFPSGLFVCQDNHNSEPGTSGAQDFKLVRLEKVIDLTP
jgi:myo-inositol-hexaphosphate 3-phosphohydrolase